MAKAKEIRILPAIDVAFQARTVDTSTKDLKGQGRNDWELKSQIIGIVNWKKGPDLYL